MQIEEKVQDSVKSDEGYRDGASQFECRQKQRECV